MTIDLPWPPVALHPNSRAHWAKRAKAAKLYRADAGMLAQAAGVRRWLSTRLAQTVPVSIAFYPPDRRKRDLDGMLSSIKSGLDGIADALGVDDNRFSLSINRCEPEKGGRVSITVGI